MRAKRCYARLLYIYIYIYYPSKIDPTIEEQKILIRLSEKDNFVVKSRRKGRYDRSIDRSITEKNDLFNVVLTQRETSIYTVPSRVSI